MTRRNAPKPVGDLDELVQFLRKIDPRRPFKNRMGLAYLDRSPTHFLAYCAVVRSLKALLPILRKPNSIVVVVVPGHWPMSMFEGIVEKVLGVEDLPVAVRDRIGVYVHPDARDLRKNKIDEGLFKKLTNKNLVVLVQAGTPLMLEIDLVMESTFEMNVCGTKDLAALARLRGNGQITEEDAFLLRQQPPSYLTAIFRPGQSLKAALKRLRERTAKASAYHRELLTLDEVPGFREASNWGKTLRRDIKQWQTGLLGWSEIDEGVLLIGAPGTGKTMFARILANTCGLAFFPHSLAQWQALGHMGDLLKGMNAAFETAKANAPSLLFLDELDSVGDRETFSGNNEHYQTEVLNALLERIDGSVGMEGVIIAGATNYPGKIDKALLRSGRLERHITFSMPDEEEREAILRFYLPGIVEGAKLTSLAKRLHGWSPADLERLSRTARRNARNNGRPVEIADLTHNFPERLPLSEKDLRRIAIHEAGHAVVAISLGMEVKRVFISRDIDPMNRSLWMGVTTTIHPQKHVKAKNDILDEISLLLAGTVAEEIVFEERTSFAAGEDGGDLHNATQLAFEYVARLGLGARLSLVPGQSVKDMCTDGNLRSEVEAILRKQFDFVSILLKRLRGKVLRLADALSKEGELSGERASAIFIGDGRFSSNSANAP